jgi:predicted transcriptional regulator
MTRKRIGQPPKGPRGERVSQYPRVALRLPPETKAALEALAVHRRQPLWLIVNEAVRGLIDRLPAADRERVTRARARRRPLRQFAQE